MTRPVWLKPPSFSGGLLVGAEMAPAGRSGRGVGPIGLVADRFDLAAATLVLAIVVVLAFGAAQTFAPMSVLQARLASLDPILLPEYAVRTVLRMLTALAASLVFTLTCGAPSCRASFLIT